MNITSASQRLVVCAATPGSGVRHRFMMMSAVKHFADRAGYSMCVLWGLTRGVAGCRFAELFAQMPGIKVVDVTATELAQLSKLAQIRRRIDIRGQQLPVFRPDDKKTRLPARFFAWDLSAAFALASTVNGQRAPLIAKPSSSIVNQVQPYLRRHDVNGRLGIRVRVEEYTSRDRKPHRIQRELDDVLKQIVQLPWHTRVFVATDSQYIQTMLASHFHDAVFLPKNFDLREGTGGYIHRLDKDVMVTFLEELTCLCSCGKIINIGGFLNEESVREKILAPPYREAIGGGGFETRPSQGTRR